MKKVVIIFGISLSLFILFQFLFSEIATNQSQKVEKLKIQKTQTTVASNAIEKKALKKNLSSPMLKESFLLGLCEKKRGSFDVEKGFIELESHLGKLESEIIDFENVHFEDQNGEIFKLQFRKDEDNIIRAYAFKEDKEGYPLPIELSVDDKKLSREDLIQKHLGKMNQVFDGRVGVKIYDDGTQVSFTEDEGKIISFELSFQGESISCKKSF